MAEMNNQAMWKSNLEARLRSVTYPATLTQLVSAAEESGADDAEMQMLKSIPDIDYQSWEEVDGALSATMA